MSKQYLVREVKLLRGDYLRFKPLVRINFEDGSECSFKGAFVAYNPEQEILEVYTEHCGYFGFYLPSVLQIRISEYKDYVLKHKYFSILNEDTFQVNYSALDRAIKSCGYE